MGDCDAMNKRNSSVFVFDAQFFLQHADDVTNYKITIMWQWIIEISQKVWAI